MQASNKDTSPNNIWGKVVYYLKQNNHSALHVICGSITQVELKEDCLVAYTYDNFVYEHLCEKSNQSVINRALVWQDLSLTFQVKKIEKVDTVEKDINKLKSLVGEYLIVIGDEK